MCWNILQFTFQKTSIRSTKFASLWIYYIILYILNTVTFICIGTVLALCSGNWKESAESRETAAGAKRVIPRYPSHCHYVWDLQCIISMKLVSQPGMPFYILDLPKSWSIFLSYLFIFYKSLNLLDKLEFETRAQIVHHNFLYRAIVLKPGIICA